MQFVHITEFLSHKGYFLNFLRIQGTSVEGAIFPCTLEQLTDFYVQNCYFMVSQDSLCGQMVTELVLPHQPVMCLQTFHIHHINMVFSLMQEQLLFCPTKTLLKFYVH